jgi:hypothetical protein
VIPFRSLLVAVVILFTAAAAEADDVFRFAPRDNTRFTRTLTRSVRSEATGVVRSETTILKSKFVFRAVRSGYQLVMTAVSFRYLVNDREVLTPVSEMVRGRQLRMNFNAVGKLTDISGYDDIDTALELQRVRFTANSPSFHLDRLPFGEQERTAWNERILLWLDQPSRTGTKLQFDSAERGFTGERVKSHTMMQVLRKKKCGAQQCVMTHYTMVPDLSMLANRANENANVDLIDAGASEELEQLIEPETMLPHYEKLTWRAHTTTASAEDAIREMSFVATSEFEYDAPR